MSSTRAHALLVALLAGAFLLSPALAAPPPQASNTGRPGSVAEPFDCGQAPALLGRPGTSVLLCQELTPSFWRVVLQDTTRPPERTEILRFVWKDGGRQEATGYGALARYLRAVRIEEAPYVDRWGMSELLDALHALPHGFDKNSLASAVDPVTRKSASIQLQPFRVTLYRPDFALPPDRPREPARPLVTTRPTGRAVLSTTADAQWTWTVSVRLAPERPWEQLHSFPLESPDGEPVR